MLGIFLECFKDDLFAGVGPIFSFCYLHEFYIVISEIYMNCFCESFDQINKKFKSIPLAFLQFYP